jgi:hypothetical protein
MDFKQVSEYPRVLTQLCVWREARGVPQAYSAVTWVIVNRADRYLDMIPDEALIHVVTQSNQFSSMTHSGDLNLIQWPRLGAVWSSVCTAVDAVFDGFTPDPTDTATYYFSPPLIEPPSAWGPVVRTGTFGTIQTFKQESA